MPETPNPPRLPDGRPAARVRTFTRRGRFSPLTQERLAQLDERRGIPRGPVDPERTFGRRAPVVLEIGCGHGAAALAYAAAFPEHDLLALDVHGPGLARMLARAEELGVPNLRIVEADAVEFLEERVGDGVFAAVHLFFPDPWPKARHAKRRFIAPARLAILHRVIAPGGHVLIATDQDFYAEHVREIAGADPHFEVSDVDRPEWRPDDGFERKGVTAGRRISELRLDRV